jgi:hypothetical protein
MLDDREICLQFQAGARYFSFLSIVSRLVSGTHPAFWSFFPRLKWPGQEADHLHLVQRLRMPGDILPFF